MFIHKPCVKRTHDESNIENRKLDLADVKPSYVQAYSVVFRDDKGIHLFFPDIMSGIHCHEELGHEPKFC